MFVGKPLINYICLKKRKKPADIMLNKAYLNSFYLSPCMKRKCRQKIWLGLQFCRLLLDLQLQYLKMSGNISSTLINGGNFIDNNFTLFCRSKTSLGIQQRLKFRGFSTKFYPGTPRPEVQPLTLLYTIFTEKVPLPYTFYWQCKLRVVSYFSLQSYCTRNLSREPWETKA